MNTANTYSPIWFETFMKSIPREQTLAEVDFVGRQLPLAGYAHIVDLCCGTGRHSIELAARGYQVLGVDIHEEALKNARHGNGGSLQFLKLDMRAIDAIQGSYDGVIVLWQSFGYYSTAENIAILSAIANLLRRRGRLVLDIYNREFFEQHQGTLEWTKNGEQIVETKRIVGDRLKVDLKYSSTGYLDQFDWEIYTEDGISETLARLGMQKVLSCTGYSEPMPVRKESPRMQIVFERI